MKVRQLTEISFVFGWLFMLIGIFMIGYSAMGTGYGLVTPTTREFLHDTSPTTFGVIHICIGFVIARPSGARRLLKHIFGTFLCMSWVGLNVWPLFTHSGNPVSIIGLLIWVSIASLLINDSYSPAYGHDYRAIED